MFRCEKTGRVTKPGEKMKKIVVETREKVYYDEDGMQIGQGREIVKEISVSPATYTRWLDEHPELKPVFKKKEQPVTSAYSAPAPVAVLSLKEEEVPQPSALQAHLEAVKQGKLVPVEQNGKIVYMPREEANEIVKGS